jgi:FAD:protein FMN transferase
MTAMRNVSLGGAADTVPVYRRVEHVMGMPISLALRGRHAGDARSLAAWQRALDVLHDVDRVFSTYRSDSYVSRLGRGEIDLVDCPPDVAEVLRLAEQARVESDGAFDVRREGPGGTVVLDPSGVVKGWAVQRAAQALATLPDTDFALSAGGDMVCRVAHPDAPAWQVGIEDPRTWDRVVAVIPVRDGAVATSGLSRRGEHIVDARTGRVPTGVLSVTVVTDNLTWADIDATAAFAHGPNAVRWLSTRPRRQGVVVWADRGPEVFSSAA